MINSAIKCFAFCFLFLLTAAIQVTAQEKPAYQLYNSSGDKISYEELLDEAREHSLIFFGEQHNSAIAHWLQYELTADLSADTTRELIIGMEMFEADQQILIDEYFQGLISQSSFEDEARLWRNYETDYKPVVEFAREHGHSLIATNIPRRYASAVFHDSLSVLDRLSEEAQRWIAPLPIEVDRELESYQGMAEVAHVQGGDNLIDSQAVKDATMAHFILKHLEEGKRMLHINGSYHSRDREGIVWYVREEESELDILTIHTITAEDPLDVGPEELDTADITLVVPSSMTTTY